MNEWIGFLTTQYLADANPTPKTALIPMSDHRLLTITGKDAATFLQGQLTCDIRRLDDHEVLLGAHCNAKGRMISSFMVAKSDSDTIALRCHESITESALTALKKYIVFSKAQLEPGNLISIALLGWESQQLQPLLNVPERGKYGHQDGMTLIHHLTGELEIWVAPEDAINLWQTLLPSTTPCGVQMLYQHWVANGLVEVRAATREEFIPQMFNYHLVDGVSFKKGCYTGQEIVARMQYRGQLKKHTYRIVSDGTVAPEIGTELVSPSTADRAAAIVVASARIANEWQGLVVCTSEIRQTEAFLVEKDSGAKFAWAELPYAIP